MFVKNFYTGFTWWVTEEHGARLVRLGDFEEVEAKEENLKKKHQTDLLTELPEYGKITANQIREDLTLRGIACDDIADKQELYALLKAVFEEVGD